MNILLICIGSILIGFGLYFILRNIGSQGDNSFKAFGIEFKSSNGPGIMVLFLGVVIILFGGGVISQSKTNNSESEKTPSNIPSPSVIDTIKSENSKYFVGMNYGGGVIYYVDHSGNHGLIVDTLNAQPELAFSNDGQFKPANEVTFSDADGKANTDKIIAVLGDKGLYAAKYCKEYKGGGFNDWFLPSKNQLYLLYQKKEAIKLHIKNDFNDIYFWCSTMNGDNACHVNFFRDDAKGVARLSDKSAVIPIREF